MIEKLEEKLNNSNFKIINDLASIIVDKKINSIEELETCQNNNFIINGKHLNDNEKISYCLNVIKNYPYDYEYLDFDEIQNYKRLMNEFDNNISNENKLKNIIILYSLTKKEMLFPYYAYNMIINDVI